MDAANFAEGHQEQMMISETDHFRECVAVVMRGADAANFADGRHRAFGFHDEPDQLHHASAGFCDARAPHALERGIQPG
jgi:hypothetical protein